MQYKKSSALVNGYFKQQRFIWICIRLDRTCKNNPTVLKSAHSLSRSLPVVHTGCLSLWEGNAISFFSHETKVSVCSLPTTQRRAFGATCLGPTTVQLTVQWGFFHQKNNFELMVTKCIWIARHLLPFPVFVFVFWLRKKDAIKFLKVQDSISINFMSTTNFSYHWIYLFFESLSICYN